MTVRRGYQCLMVVALIVLGSGQARSQGGTVPHPLPPVQLPPSPVRPPPAIDIGIVRSEEVIKPQNPGMYTRGDWQTSLEPAKWVDGKPYVYTASGSIKIGVRDKFGAMGGYSATFVVTAPNSRAYKELVKVSGDDWGYATFPDDFNASSLRRGIWSVKIYVKSQLVVAFKVNYTPK